MSEETPSAPTPESEEAPDYSQMTLDELEQRLEQGEGVIEDEEEPAPPEPTPEPEPEPAPEEAPAQEVQPEEQGEATPTPEPSEPEFDEQASILEEMRLESERVRRDRDKFEFLASREAGAKGHLQKRVEQLEEVIRQATQPQAPTDSVDYSAETEAPQAPVQPFVDTGLQSRVAELETDQREEGIRQEYLQFLNDNKLSGKDQEELTGVMSELAPDFQRHYEPYKGMDLNAKASRKVFRMALDSAFTDLKLARVKKAREEALAKRAAQVGERKIAKQAAVVSGSGASPAPKPTAKSPEEMTAEEADAALKAEFGDGQRRRRRR